MANISELNIGQGNVEIEATIIEIGEIRTFNKYGRELRVADAVIKDDSGSMKLTLWNDDTERFKEGDKIKVSNGFVREFQGEKQLTSGKFGAIEKVGEEETSEQETLPTESAEESTETPTEEPAEEKSSEQTEENSDKEPIE